MNIIFDSNVWQIIALPDDNLGDPFLKELREIRQAIVDKRIQAFLSETIFTIEVIKKEDRKDFISSQKIKVEVKENEGEDGGLSFSISIGPHKDDAISFNDNPKLGRYFTEAINLGFNIVNLPRIGGFVNTDIEGFRYKHDEKDFSKYLDKVSEVVTKIENRGAGMRQLERIGEKYNSKEWRKGLKLAPVSDKKKISKAAAEWADGDSVAISIALNCDYFCTRDKATGAGNKSVLSSVNKEWLSREYNFKTILPEELAKLI